MCGVLPSLILISLNAVHILQKMLSIFYVWQLFPLKFSLKLDITKETL